MRVRSSTDDVADGWEAEASLARYFDFYCQRRIHQSLGYCTPVELHRKGKNERKVGRSNSC